METAVEVTMKGTLFANKAADFHGVPHSMLKDCLSGRVIHGVNPRPRPYLTADEEVELSVHLLQASEIGLAKTRHDVLALVSTYIK